MVRRKINEILEWLTLLAIKREAKNIITILGSTDSRELGEQIQRARDALDVLAPCVLSAEGDIGNILLMLGLKPGEVITKHYAGGSVTSFDR